MPHETRAPAPLVSSLESGLHQIRLPMAGNPLGHVNGYLIPGKDGYTLIDCGWDTPDVFEALVEGLAHLGLGVRDISLLVVTHFHHDHYGMAGKLLAENGAQLWMHELDWQHVDKMLSDLDADERRSDTWLARNGVDPTTIDDGNEFMEEASRRYSVVAPDRTISDGDIVARGQNELKTVWTPGHSPGHLCFWDEERGFVLSGDHILDPITPHVGSWYENRHDVLDDYLASLRKMAALPAHLVLPAHGEPFEGLQRRVDELLAHHDVRTAQIVEALRAGPADAAEVAARLPWTRRRTAFAALAPAHKQFAVAETLAHLQHLEHEGVVRVISEEPTIQYATAG